MKSFKVLKSAMLIVGVLLVGCKDKTLFEEVEVDNDNTEEIKKGAQTRQFQIADVIVTADSDTLPVKSIITFEVFAETEALFDVPQAIAAHNQAPRVNISALSELKLESMDPEILFIPEGERIGVARKEGVVTVYAHFRGVQSAPLKLEILPALTSCGAVNNTDKNNASGACLKVLKGWHGEAKDKLFTGTPSSSFLDALNYRKEDTFGNTGKTYATTLVGIGKNATAGAHFGLFRQDGQEGTLDGSNGQYDRFCQHLVQLHFLTRTDWRRATGQELSDLYQGSGNLFNNYGVFNQVPYWSVDQSMPGRQAAFSFQFFRVGLDTGFIFASGRASSMAASCVSSSGR